MDNLVLILLITVIVLLVMFIGLLAFFGHRFLKLKEQNKVEEKPVVNLNDASHEKKESISPKLLSALRSNDKTEFQSSVYCVDHPDVFSHGKCAISYDALCENCLTKQENILIGRKYLDLFLDNDWVELQMVKDEKELRRSYINIKKRLWEQEDLPVIVQGHFKINIQDDKVEQYIVILSRQEDIARVRDEFSI